MKKISTVAHMPTNIEVNNISDNEIEVIAYPFEAGFAITLAHPLRRLLFSSTSGYAPVAIKIDGVSHEFDSMRGMLEDVALFLINLKNIRFKLKNDKTRAEISYSFNGYKEIHGKDLNNEEVEVVTPDVYLATINEDASLNFSLIIEQGIGYVPSEDIRDMIGNDYLILDAFFTPVKKATYEIENMLVEDNPNFEKIVFKIETNGVVNPIDAFKSSIEAMYAQMSVFNNILDINTVPKAQVKQDTVDISKLLQHINDISLSARSFNCLDKADVKYIGELALMSENEIKNLKNLGKKSLDEIKMIMDELGFPVGNTLPSDISETLRIKLASLKAE